MATNKTINQLPDGGALLGTDEFPINRGGADNKILGSQFLRTSSFLRLSDQITTGTSGSLLQGNWVAVSDFTNTITQISGNIPGFTLLAGKRYCLECLLYITSLTDGEHLFVHWYNSDTNSIIFSGAVGGAEYVAGASRESMPSTIKAFVQPLVDTNVRLYISNWVGTMTIYQNGGIRSTSIFVSEI